MPSARDCSLTDDEHGTEHCATASDADGHHNLLLICPAPFGVMMDCGLPLHRNREHARTSAPAECVNSRLTIVLMRSVREAVVAPSRDAGTAAWDVPLGGQDAGITVPSSFVWLGNWVPVVFCGSGRFPTVSPYSWSPTVYGHPYWTDTAT